MLSARSSSKPSDPLHALNGPTRIPLARIAPLTRESKLTHSAGRKKKVKMRQKKMAGIFLAAIFVGAIIRPAMAQEGSRKLLVAYAGLISTHASVWLGEDQGFYKKHGLDVTAVLISSGSLTSQALVAGEAKLASTSVGPTAGAVSAGAAAASARLGCCPRQDCHHASRDPAGSSGGAG